ncbi:MAG: TVP38/TMEM64 family protein, partial [Erysipelotrichaceae bacterium]|nr:TVP38/TMEM64 family protein [Erysipelotrichaceae bacterium]
MNRSVSRYVKISAVLALILFIVFSIYIGKYLLTFINDPEMFRNWIDSFGIYAPLAYCGVTILQILFPLIPGEPMEMIAGYAFGSLQGTLLCILAESLGSILVLLAVKKYGRKIVEIFFEKEKIDSLKFLRSDKHRILLFALIFIVPGTPKDLLCYLAGLTDIETRILIPIITIGRLPSIITSTLAGDHLGDQSYIKAAIYIAIA